MNSKLHNEYVNYDLSQSVITPKEQSHSDRTTAGHSTPIKLTEKSLTGLGSGAAKGHDHHDDAASVSSKASRASTLRGDLSGRETDAATTKRAITFYNGRFSHLVQRNAPAHELDEALVEEEGVRFDAESGVWVFGPHSLSEWPPSKPFLVEAARLGGARIVDRLARHYMCSVETTDRAGGTAMHQAAYFGHADVVATLLEFGADPLRRNKEGETALDRARQARVDWKSGAFKFPKLSGESGVFDFRTRDAGWPHWEEAIRRLS